jgi:hypothetical protein
LASSPALFWLFVDLRLLFDDIVWKKGSEEKKKRGESRKKERKREKCHQADIYTFSTPTQIETSHEVVALLPYRHLRVYLTKRYLPYTQSENSSGQAIHP